MRPCLKPWRLLYGPVVNVLCTHPRGQMIPLPRNLHVYVKAVILIIAPKLTLPNPPMGRQLNCGSSISWTATYQLKVFEF